MIYFILAASLLLRLISLNQSLWLDEAINVLAVKNNSFWYVVTKYPIYDFHPPGYFMLLWFWTRLFGYSEIWVRLPSVLLGVLNVWLVFLLGKKLFSKNVGLIAALLLAVNPLHIYYSQEARMYVLAAMAVSLSWLLLNTRWYLLSLILVLMSDYVAYFIIPVQLLVRSKGKLGRLEILGTVGIFGVVWGKVLLEQIKNGLLTAANIPGWHRVVGGFGVKPLALIYVKFIIGRINIDNDFWHIGLFIPIGIFFLYLLYKGRDKLLLFWMLIPLTTSWLVSALVPVFSYFRVLFLLSAFVLMVAKGLSVYYGRTSLVLTGIAIFIFTTCSAIYLSAPTLQREDWRSLADFLAGRQRGSKIVLESNDSFAPLEYYAGQSLNMQGGLNNIPASKMEDVKADFDDGKQVYLVNYLVEITDPGRLLKQKLLELNYKQENVFNFNGVGLVYLYTKQ